MPRLDREQAISVAVLVLLLLVSASAVGMLLQTRADALQESSERREMLSRLEAKLREHATRPTAAAPPTAFLDASTPGLASAQLQSDRKSTRLNSSHGSISYAVFCLKKKK